MFFRVLATAMFGIWVANALAMIVGAVQNQSDYDTLMLSLGALWLAISVALWLLAMKLTRHRPNSAPQTETAE